MSLGYVTLLMLVFTLGWILGARLVGRRRDDELVDRHDPNVRAFHHRFRSQTNSPPAAR